MNNIFIVAVAVALLTTVLLTEKRGFRAGLLLFKTALSGLFVLTAWLQPHLIPRYTLLLMVGLIFCMGGDVFLAFPQRRMFLLGLVSFLVGHLFYGAAFFGVAPLNPWTGFGSLGVLVTSAGVYLWLRPHLGTMKKPVEIYVVIISVMVAGAVTVAGDPRLDPAGRIMVLVGAVSFYVSDVFVARDRFIHDEFFNRLIGLPLYYGGQFLLAFSLGSLRILA